jgi:hypothetical protein
MMTNASSGMRRSALFSSALLTKDTSLLKRSSQSLSLSTTVTAAW